MLDSWFSVKWFTISTFSQFSFENKYFLYAMPVIPFVYLFRLWTKKKPRQSLNVAFVEKKRIYTLVAYLRFLPHVLSFLITEMLLLALARPQIISSYSNNIAEGVDIMLAIDVSESMLSKDVFPTRLEAAKKMAESFIQYRQHDRVGLVVFSGEAYSLCPLTTDYDLLKNYLKTIAPNQIKISGTALGNALGVCINRLRDAPGKSKIAVLITDGDNTAGNLPPSISAQLAKSFGIKVYSIAVGDDKNTLDIVDESSLKEIAKLSDGVFFRAKNAQTLNEIFKEINLLEKTPSLFKQIKNIEEFYSVYVKWALFLILISLLLKSTFVNNILED
ncbi:MAG: VWA domain-containing protein [Pseudarcicella sp.]|nr:VWA domain-containing protein [Pseudarcicella sp.]MBP6410940.1 VWA domain-containing protein [Pseudarcicella sp.]